MKISFQNPLVVALLLLAAAVVAHAGAFGAGWIWDDDDYITANMIIQSPDGWSTLWIPGATPQYYPLVFLGFWAEHAAGGLDPTLFHATNVLLHAASTLLLWRIFTRLGVPVPALIAALFAVHPMGVESVAWATERKNTQSLFFALASILCFLHATRAGERRVIGTHIVAFVLFVCALLSKTTAVFVAPALVLIALHERRRIDVRFVLLVLPYFLVGAALGVFTAYVEKVHVGASGAEFALAPLERVQLAARNIVLYLARFTFPREQIFVYPRHEISMEDPLDWIPLAMMLVLAGTCIVEWRRSRAPLLILLWLCAALFPALGFLDVWPFRFSYEADHFAYAAMPALATGLVLLVMLLVRAASRNPRIGTIAVSAFIAVSIPLSWIASEKYADAESLWRDTVARNPGAWLAQNNLASEMLAQAARAQERGDEVLTRALATEALGYAEAAVALKPDEYTHPSNLSEALRLLGRNEEALAAIDDAVALAPAMAEFRWMRGRVLESLGRDEDARVAFTGVAEDKLDRSHEIDARLSLMRLALKRKDFADAIAQSTAVVALQPRDADAIANLGALLQASGDEDGARRALLRAITSGAEFSSEPTFVATAVRYLRLAIGAKLDPDEQQVAAALAGDLIRKSPANPALHYLSLALAVRSGDRDARAQLESLERDARAAKADQLADEMAAFLRAN